MQQLRTILLLIGIATGIYLSFHAWSQLPHYETLSGTVSITQDVAYGPSPEEKLDVCTPREVKPNRPAVVMIHGGAWVMGDKSGNFPALCSLLAKNGIVAVNINYRLFSMKTLHNRWPAQLQDAQLAVRWLRAHAADYHVDPGRLCADGISAGGQLALFLGLLKENQPGDRAQLYSEQRPDVKCVVDDQGVADLLSVSPQLAELESGLVVAEPGEEVTAALKKASPLYAMNSRMVPVLIIHGDGDDVVLSKQAHALKEKLEQAKVPVQMVIFHGGHVYEGLSRPQMVEFIQRHVQFLVEQLRP